MRYYNLTITTTSKETEDRQLTPYTDIDTAERKYHEALTGIGGGSFRIASALLDNNLNIIKKEVWSKQFTVTLVDDDSTSEIKATAGTDITLPTTEELVGWTITEGDTQLVDNPYHVTSDITLYAVYRSATIPFPDEV